MIIKREPSRATPGIIDAENATWIVELYDAKSTEFKYRSSLN